MSLMRDRYLDSPALTRRTLLAAPLILVPAIANAAECKTTSRVTKGPYWRPGAPETNDIRLGKRGDDILVRGVVRAAAGCAPVAGTLIEVWQADADGQYDLDYGRGETFLRGRIRTGKDGSYAFRTIRPAAYGLAGSKRPAHIHVVVNGLVTQIYFADDPHLDSDPLRAVRDDLVVKVVKGEARFDINV